LLALFPKRVEPHLVKRDQFIDFALLHARHPRRSALSFNVATILFALPSLALPRWPLEGPADHAR
jgi:hypothetical protein